jgi:hypothetical protein
MGIDGIREESLSILSAIAAAAAGSGVVFWSFSRFFDKVEKVTSPEFKKPLSELLQRIKIPNASNVMSKNVVYAYNSFFGSAQFSWQCVGRVIIFSAVAMAISLIAVRGWKPLFTTTQSSCTGALELPLLAAAAESDRRFELPPDFRFDVPPPCTTFDVTGEAAKSLLMFFFVINLPIDYVAVGMTRILLGGLRRFQFSWRIVMLLALCDIVVKCILLKVGLDAITRAEVILYPCDPAERGLACLGGISWDFVMGVLSGTGLKGPIARASLLSLLVSSLWIWMYNVGLLALRSERTGTTINWLRRALDIKNQPIGAAGFLAALLSAAVTFPVILILQI